MVNPLNIPKMAYTWKNIINEMKNKFLFSELNKSCSLYHTHLAKLIVWIPVV